MTCSWPLISLMKEKYAINHLSSLVLMTIFQKFTMQGFLASGDTCPRRAFKCQTHNIIPTTPPRIYAPDSTLHCVIQQGYTRLVELQRCYPWAHTTMAAKSMFLWYMMTPMCYSNPIKRWSTICSHVWRFREPMINTHTLWDEVLNNQLHKPQWQISPQHQNIYTLATHLLHIQQQTTLLCIQLRCFPCFNIFMVKHIPNF